MFVRFAPKMAYILAVLCTRSNKVYFCKCTRHNIHIYIFLVVFFLLTITKIHDAFLRFLRKQSIFIKFERTTYGTQ